MYPRHGRALPLTSPQLPVCQSTMTFSRIVRFLCLLCVVTRRGLSHDERPQQPANHTVSFKETLELLLDFVLCTPAMQLPLLPRLLSPHGYFVWSPWEKCVFFPNWISLRKLPQGINKVDISTCIYTDLDLPFSLLPRRKNKPRCMLGTLNTHIHTGALLFCPFLCSPELCFSTHCWQKQQATEKEVL